MGRHGLPLARHQPRPLMAAMRCQGEIRKRVNPFVDVAAVCAQQVYAHAVTTLVKRQSRQVKADAGMALRVGGLQVSGWGQGRADDFAAVRGQDHGCPGVWLLLTDLQKNIDREVALTALALQVLSLIHIPSPRAS